MRKILLLSFLVFGFCFQIINTNAAAAIDIASGTELVNAIDGASDGDVLNLKLTADIVTTSSIVVNGITVNIDLNGHNITSGTLASNVTQSFKLRKGTLSFTGSGKVSEALADYAAVIIYGTTDSTQANYSILNVGKDVELESWAPIWINRYSNFSGTTSNEAYGVVVNLEGTLTSLNDTAGDAGSGIYVHGNVKGTTGNTPIVNIESTAKITSATGVGIYAAGYANFNIKDGAEISGYEMALGIKSGKFNIEGGTFYANGPKNTATGNSSGINGTGSVIQVEANNGYAGGVELVISGGTFTSENASVINEYRAESTDGSGNVVFADDHLDSIVISGGTFVAAPGENVFIVSDDFEENHTGFITGGSFSSDPTSYLSEDIEFELDDDGNFVKKVIGNNDPILPPTGEDIISTRILGLLTSFIFVLYIFIHKNRKLIA